MKSLRSIAVVTAAVLISLIGAAAAFAQESSMGSRVEVSVLGGIHALNKNDTALPDQLLSVPAVTSVSYQVTPNLAAEGDFTWLIPMQQSLDLGTGIKQDRKAPDILAYQAGVRAGMPLSTWTPYVAAGAGAMTFLSNTDADRLPQLGKSQTMFALNFGGGAQVGLNSAWGLRADFREFVAFPSKDAVGFSANGTADPIWMERGTVGIAYRF
jgi:opacity protein-like surface antigen